MIRNLWADLWPNMVAPSVWTIIAIVIAHFKAKAHRESIHAEHLAAAAAGRQVLLDQAEANHQAATVQRDKNQQDILDRADAHHAALTAAVSARGTAK